MSENEIPLQYREFSTGIQGGLYSLSKLRAPRIVPKKQFWQMWTSKRWQGTRLAIHPCKGVSLQGSSVRQFSCKAVRSLEVAREHGIGAERTQKGLVRDLNETPA
jgi:hypothetical protein